MIKKIFKNSLITASILTSFVTMNAYSIDLNNLENEESKAVETEIIKLFNDGNKEGVTIENLRQLDKSDNYIFKYQEDQNYYTMMYIRDIKAVFIQTTSEIFSLENKDFITKNFNADFTRQYLKEIDLKDSITYEGTDKENSDEIFVFTDPTCGYCQKLHREKQDYLDQNITIHYLPFPRGGLLGPGYEMLVNTYCSNDKKESLTEAKFTQSTPKITDGTTPDQLQQCKDTVKKYYDLGSKMGVKGTPAIFSIKGTQLGGYLPSQQMRFALNQDLGN